MMMSRGAAVLLVGLLLGAGAALRLAGLGRASLDVDEYLHVLPARAWLAEGRPLLPSGHEYRRAWPYTAAVAAVFALTGTHTEAVSRLPSVVAGTLLVLLAFAVARRWFGLGAGLWAAALTAAAPVVVSTAKLCRMYAPFECLYLLAMFVVWELVWRPGVAARGRVIGAGLAVGVLLAGLTLHTLTVVFVLAFAGFLAGRAMMHPRSADTAWLVAGVAGLAAAHGVGLINLRDAWTDVNYAPSWAQQSRYYAPYYWELWGKDFPVLLRAAPLLLAWVVWRYRALGWYVVAMAVIPLALHSLVFDWKIPRYVSYLMAPLCVALSPALAAATAWLPQRLGLRGTGRLGQAAVAGALGALAMGAALPRAIRGVQQPASPQWREALAYVRAHAAAEDAVITSLPLAAQYYLGRPGDYAVNNYSAVDFQDRMHRDAEGRWVDWYSGLPFLTNAAEWEQAVARHPSGWCVISQDRFEADAGTPPEIRAWLDAHAQREPSDASMVVYRWGGATP